MYVCISLSFASNWFKEEEEEEEEEEDLSISDLDPRFSSQITEARFLLIGWMMMDVGEGGGAGYVHTY